MSSKKKTSAKSNVPQSIDTKSLDREGQNFLAAGNYEGAIATWNRLLKVRGGMNAPINAPLLVKLAEANLLAASALPHSKRLPYLVAACHCLPNSSAMLLRLLQFCRETGNWQAALAFTQEMMQEKKHRPLFEKLSYLVLLISKGNLPKQSPFTGEDYKRVEALSLLSEKKSGKGLHLLGSLNVNEYHMLVKALFHLANKEVSEARTFLEKAAASTGDEVVVLFAQYYLAVAMIQQGQYELAENTLLPSLARMQKYPYFTNLLRHKRVAAMLADVAWHKAKSGELEKAVSLWETALVWDENNNNAAVNLNQASEILAGNYAKEGRLEKAINFWQSLRQKHPEHTGFAKNLALAYQKLERFGEAIPCWERVVETAEQALLREKDLAKSKTYLVQCCQQLALCYAAAERGADAERIYLRLLELEPHDLNHKTSLVEHYLEERQLKPAFVLLEELVNKEPGEIKHLTHMGMAYDLADNAKAAVGCWEKALSLEANAAMPFALLCQGYQYIANTAYRNDKPEEAVAFLDKLLARQPKHDYALALKGILYLKKGERSTAEKLFGEAIATKPGIPDVYLTIGRMCLEQKQSKEAEDYFARVQQLAGEKYPLHDILAKIGSLYLQQDLIAYNEKGRRSIRCQNLSACGQAYAYFEKAIAVGGYDVALSVAEFLVELNCDHLPDVAQRAHALKEQEPTPLFYMAIYYCKHHNQEKFEGVVKMAQESPDFANNKQMQELVSHISQLRQIFTLPQQK